MSYKSIDIAFSYFGTWVTFYCLMSGTCFFIFVAIALIFDYMGLFVLGWSITQEEELDMKTIGSGFATSF